MPKRRRQSTAQDERAPGVRSAPRDKHEVFIEYAKSRGVLIGSVAPAALPGRGTGLVATAHIEKDERVIFVPEKAMIKPDVAVLKKYGLDKTASPQAQLTFSLAAALARRDSPIQVWEATWPTAQDVIDRMPHLWDETLLELLPPSVLQPLDRQRTDFQKDLRHEAVSQRLVEDAGRRIDWPYLWSIVNSRCFHFKPPGSKPGFMVLCPFIDYFNHGPTGSGCNVMQSYKGYEVTADRDYEAGEELLVTYGSSSNEKLLVQYGFICGSEDDISVDDDVRLDHLILPKLDSQTRQQLQDVGYLGSYALVPATNEICFKTHVAVRAALLTAIEWEYFITNGEDLSDDQSAKVKEWLRPMVESYMSDAVQKLDEIETHAGHSTPALALLKTRWTQIRDALMSFLQDP